MKWINVTKFFWIKKIVKLIYLLSRVFLAWTLICDFHDFFQTQPKKCKYIYIFWRKKKSDGLLLTLSHLSSDNCRGDWKMSRLGLFLRWILGTCWAMCQPAAEIFGAKMEKKTSHFKKSFVLSLLSRHTDLPMSKVWITMTFMDLELVSTIHSIVKGLSIVNLKVVFFELRK